MVLAVQSMKEVESGGSQQVQSQLGLGKAALAETNKTTALHRWKGVWRGREDSAMYEPIRGICTGPLCRALWPPSLKDNKLSLRVHTASFLTHCKLMYHPRHVPCLREVGVASTQSRCNTGIEVSLIAVARQLC